MARRPGRASAAASPTSSAPNSVEEGSPIAVSPRATAMVAAPSDSHATIVRMWHEASAGRPAGGAGRGPLGPAAVGGGLGRGAREQAPGGHLPPAGGGRPRGGGWAPRERAAGGGGVGGGCWRGKRQ